MFVVTHSQWALAWQDLNFVNRHLAANEWSQENLISTWPLPAANQGFLSQFQVALADPLQYAGFSAASYTQSGFIARLEDSYNQFDYRLNMVLDKSDTNFLSGSYLRLSLGNWFLSFDRQERWWGPAWSGSLILGNASEPFPAISLQRKKSLAFHTKWLAWLGPWNMSLFAGQLEQNRFVPHAKLLGARFSFSPLDKLEFGMSRTAQWGGEGRPQDLESLGRLILGLDNTGSNGITAENQPGNQLAGFDMIWQISEKFPMSIYAQVIGEDEANFFPTAFMGLFGIEMTRGAHYRTYLEYADTRVDYYRSERRYGTAYNHSVYQSGYTYNGKSLAHSLGGDGQMTAFGQMWVYSQKVSYHLLFRSIRPDVINLDEKNRRSIYFAAQWNKADHRIQAAVEWYRDIDRIDGQADDNVAGNISWTFRLK